jgi:4-amino-4-deoxy-L-arabinose transferase-like glycosyltransferase
VHIKERFNFVLADKRLPWLLCAGCLVVIFCQLGAAALFEPDEGRNAERAREILELDNWLIPHENFLPALDKPVFLYWLIAISYKVFGISEWSARLPSALAALGCLFVLYRFARIHWGLWEALWAVLVLATGVEFFMFSRLVIFDMTLTFFTTIALCEFYSAAQTEDKNIRRRHCLLMYSAMALATLLKGPIGVMIPGMVFFFYLLLTRKWRLLSQMDMVIGALVFIAIVAPWYVWAEARNPGYLRYFLLEENYFRFLTPHFRRTKIWYYYFLVVGAGFAPWSVLIPFVVNDLRKKAMDDRNLYLILWIVVPFVFFTLSNSKLPHYILPIFPALAILTAKTLMAIVGDTSAKSRWPLTLPLLVIGLCVVFFIAGSVWASLLHNQIRQIASQTGPSIWPFGGVLAVVLGIFAFAGRMGKWREQRLVYLCYYCTAIIFSVFMGHIAVSVSYQRSAKQLAQNAAPFINPEHQLAFYDEYLTGLPFYLRVKQPIWVVWSGVKTIIMHNIYVAQKQPPPAAGYGPVLLTFDEFTNEWQKSKQPLLVFIKNKNISRLTEAGTAPTKTLTKTDEYSLVTNR